jgi:hypothetical protein
VPARAERYSGGLPQRAEEASPSPVYGAALLMRFGFAPIRGSNPRASARLRPGQHRACCPGSFCRNRLRLRLRLAEPGPGSGSDSPNRARTRRNWLRLRLGTDWSHVNARLVGFAATQSVVSGSVAGHSVGWEAGAALRAGGGRVGVGDGATFRADSSQQTGCVAGLVVVGVHAKSRLVTTPSAMSCPIQSAK